MMKMGTSRHRKKYTPSTIVQECISSVHSAPNGGQNIIHIKEEPLSPQPDLVSSTNEHVNKKRDGHGFVQPETQQCALYQCNKEHFNRASPESVFNNATQNPPEDRSLYRILDEEEKSLISELAVSYESVMCSYVDEKEDPNSESTYTDTNSMVNQCASAVVRLIKFSKTLFDFKTLAKEDQISTLKMCVVSSLLLRSVSFYDEINDGFRTPTGVIRTSVLKQAVGDPTYHDAYIAYCISLKSLVKDDYTILSIMETLLIFNAEAPDLMNRSSVSQLQDKYMLILKHQLEATYSYLHATKVMACILQKITELQVVADKHSEMLLQVDPKKIEPLLLEVLSIN